jgi:hypothetical protein
MNLDSASSEPGERATGEPFRIIGMGSDRENDGV